MTTNTAIPSALDKRSRPRASALGRRALVVLFTVVALGGLLVPIVSVLLESRSTPTFQAYADELTSPVFLEALARSLIYSVVVTLVTLAIGFPAAYMLTLCSRRVFIALLITFAVPQVTSLLVRTYSWIAVLGVDGPVVKFLNAVGFDAQSLVGTDVGVVIVLVHFYLPYVILTSYASMRTIRPEQVKAAQSLGAGRIEAFWSVYAPQALPGVIAGGLFVFVITAAMFGIPSLIGGVGQSTVSVLVVQQTVTGFATDPAAPAAQAVILALVVLPIVALGVKFVGIQKFVGLGGGRAVGADPKIRPLRVTPARALLARLPKTPPNLHLTVVAMTGLALVLTVLPFVYLFWISFQPLPLLQVPTEEFSTAWYERVLSDRGWLEVAISSLQIAGLGTLLAVVLGWFLAARTVNARPRQAGLLMGLATLPLVIPAITIGQGYFGVFADLGLLGNWWAIAFVHAVVILPYVYINVLSGMSSYDQRYDDAAASLGASRSRTLLKVRLPILQQFVVTGAFLAFLVSFDEFTVTRFLTGISYETLPVKFYSAASQNLSPELAAVGSLVVGSMLALMAVHGLFLLRTRAKSSKLKESHDLH